MSCPSFSIRSISVAGLDFLRHLSYKGSRKHSSAIPRAVSPSRANPESSQQDHPNLPWKYRADTGCAQKDALIRSPYNRGDAIGQPWLPKPQPPQLPDSCMGQSLQFKPQSDRYGLFLTKPFMQVPHPDTFSLLQTACPQRSVSL